MNDDLRYQTGVDAVMAVVAIGSLAPLPIIGWSHPETLTIMFGVTAATLALYVYLYRTTFYVLETDGLRIQCGPIKLFVKYEDIRKAAPSSTIMSGYALSMKRIEVEYHRFDVAIISPADRQGFLEELARRAPRADVRTME